MKSKSENRKGADLHDAATKGLPLNRAELAECLGVHVETVSAWVKQGMPCVFLGKVQRPVKGARPRFIFPRCLEWIERRNG